MHLARFIRDAKAVAGARLIYACWLGSKTGAIRSFTLDLSKDQLQPGEALTLVTLSANSTNGIQSALTAGTSGTLQLKVGEVPSFVLIGAAPQPPTGPVPPLTPESGNCHNLTRGFNCTASGIDKGYIMCPTGEAGLCPDAELCHQVSPGVVKCMADGKSVCQSKGGNPGLYCAPGVKPPGPGWGQAYEACPQAETLWCPPATPTCVQQGATVACE